MHAWNTIFVETIRELQKVAKFHSDIVQRIEIVA